MILRIQEWKFLLLIKWQIFMLYEQSNATKSKLPPVVKSRNVRFLQIYNHGQTFWRKVALICVVFFLSHTCATPPLPHKQHWTLVSRIFLKFNPSLIHSLTLGTFLCNKFTKRITQKRTCSAESLNRLIASVSFCWTPWPCLRKIKFCYKCFLPLKLILGFSVASGQNSWQGHN